MQTEKEKENLAPYSQKRSRHSNIVEIQSRI